MPNIDFRFNQTHNNSFEIKNNKEKHVIPFEQKYGYGGNFSVITIPCPDVISSSDVDNGKLRFFDLRPDDCGKIDDAFFRFKVSSTSAIVHLPGPEMVREWYIKPNKGSGQEIFRYYPETIVGWINSLPEKQKKMWHNLANMKETVYEYEGVNKYWDNKDISIQANHSKYIYLPIPWTVLHSGAIDMEHISKALRFYIQFEDDFFVSGTSSNFSLDSIDLIVYNSNELDGDRIHRMNKKKMNKFSYIYLNIDRLEVNDKTLTAGSSTKYELEPLSNQLSAFLQVCIKNGTSPAASDRSKINYVPLNGGTIDIERNSGASLLGRGTPIREDELYYKYSDDFNTYPVKGLYFIPFTDSFSSALNGEIKGYHKFESANTNKLSLTFSAASVAEVHTITLTNSANDGGYYRLIVKGEITILLAYNANVAAIKAALEALSILKEYDVEVTASAAATATFTITFSVKNGQINQNIGVIKLIEHTLNDGSVGEIAVSSISTYGIPGFTTSSSYTTIIDSYYYKRLTINEDGSLYVETLE